MVWYVYAESRPAKHVFKVSTPCLLASDLKNITSQENLSNSWLFISATLVMSVNSVVSEISLINLSNIPKMSMEYLWIIPDISAKYPWCVSQIFLKYLRNISDSQISLKYLSNIPKITRFPLILANFLVLSSFYFYNFQTSSRRT